MLTSLWALKCRWFFVEQEARIEKLLLVANLVIAATLAQGSGIALAGSLVSTLAGAITGVSGTPQDGADTRGSVTFDIVFTSLKNAGKKDFGVAHLNLVNRRRF